MNTKPADSLLDAAHPLHFPTNPQRFSFDEVAPFFQRMAERSIPDYERAHALHTRMLRPWIAGAPHVKILDAGASRGRFIDHLAEEYGQLRLEDGTLDITALDCSAPMCEALRQRYPSIGVRLQDLAADEFVYGEGVEQYDVVCAFYVLQFIHPSRQQSVLRRLLSLVKPGGVFILGQKSAFGGKLGSLAHEAYLEWRMANGYTAEEIAAKTRALAGSMWPMEHSEVLHILHETMREVFETSRTGMFNTLMARK